MNLNERHAKLLQRQQQLTAALQANQAQILSRQRKEQARAKIILGGALLSLPSGEREALLSMLTPHLNEREQRFITEHLANSQVSGAAPTNGSN